MTVKDKAFQLLADRKVRFVPGSHYHFDVIGESADAFQPKPYRVVIDGFDTCDCAARGTCSHLIAARMALDVFLRRGTK